MLLTHFHTGDPLSGELLDVLVTRAPNLTHLHGRSISAQSDALAGTQWGVKELKVDMELRIEQLSGLPGPRSGRMVVAGESRDHRLLVSVTSIEVRGMSYYVHYPESYCASKLGYLRVRCMPAFLLRSHVPVHVLVLCRVFYAC